MLKGVSKYVSPKLLEVLHSMGHGDEIVLADAHFPGHSLGPQVIRADGIPIRELLAGILPLFALDSYEPPLAMMEVVAGDGVDSGVEEDYMEVIRIHAPETERPVRMERYAFYDRARKAFAIVITGETRKYGNLLLKKGVTPVD